MNVTTYSATLQWVTPYLAYTQEQYTINFGTTRDSLSQSSPVLSSTTDISASNVTYDISIQDLSPNTVYYFQIRIMNSYGETTTGIMTFTTSEAGKINTTFIIMSMNCVLYPPIAGPSSPPMNFEIVALGPESVRVSWGPPPQEAQNGIIIAYTLTCQPEEMMTLPMTYPAAGNYILNGFRPATSYNCTVLATTSGGSGPPALQTVTLPSGGMYISTRA